MAHVELSTSIRSDADSLWNEIGAFGRVGDWHPLLDHVQTEGRRRIAYGKDGSRQVESLLESNARARRYRYEMVETPIPVSNYTAELSIEDNHDGTSTVHWSADFDVADRQHSKTVAAVESFFMAGLDNLKARHS